jgi:Flp pilus assembly protein TadG
MSFLRRLFKCESGTASIETIIVLPLAISLMAGGAEFGQIWSDWGTANKSIRDATRYLARLDYNSICNWGTDNAKKITVYGTIDGATALISGWTTDQVMRVSPDCTGEPPKQYPVQLQATVPYTGTMLQAIRIANSITFTVTHEEPQVGR